MCLAQFKKTKLSPTKKAALLVQQFARACNGKALKANMRQHVHCHAIIGTYLNRTSNMIDAAMIVSYTSDKESKRYALFELVFGGKGVSM